MRTKFYRQGGLDRFSLSKDRPVFVFRINLSSNKVKIVRLDGLTKWSRLFCKEFYNYGRSSQFIKKREKVCRKIWTRY